MLNNAMILRIDRKNGHDAAGNIKWQVGSIIAAACFVAGVSSRQRYAMGASIEDADQTCYVLTTELINAGEDDIATGDRLSIQPDNGNAYTCDVVNVTKHRVSRGTGNTHLEIFLRSQPLKPGA